MAITTASLPFLLLLLSNSLVPLQRACASRFALYFLEPTKEVFVNDSRGDESLVTDRLGDRSTPLGRIQSPDCLVFGLVYESLNSWSCTVPSSFRFDRCLIRLGVIGADLRQIPGVCFA